MVGVEHWGCAVSRSARISAACLVVAHSVSRVLTAVAPSRRAPQLHKKRSLFSRSDFDVLAVLNATGPWALRAAFRAFGKDQGLLYTSYIGAWRINATNVMVYPLGTWWASPSCQFKSPWRSLFGRQNAPLLLRRQRGLDVSCAVLLVSAGSPEVTNRDVKLCNISLSCASW